MDWETRVIAEANRMKQSARASGYGYWQWDTTLTNGRQRLAALKAGLLPVRISGRFFSLQTLIREAQHIPSEIVDQAAVAVERFPGSQAVVYGWDREALPEERRRRDPVLVLRHGAQQFFLGFWLEVETGDTAIPEFFGIIAPWSEKRGRGRPRKDAAMNHPLLKAGGE